MKKFLVLLSLMLTMSITAFSQTDFSVWGGYSWLNGVVGAEAQFGNVGFSAGYFPTKMPGSGESISSFSAAVTYYLRNNEYLDSHSGTEGACWYGSFGVASAGYRSEVSYNGGAWTNDYIEPVYIGMVGVKSYYQKWQFKLGCGYGFYGSGSNVFTWEIGLSYALFSSHSY